MHTLTKVIVMVFPTIPNYLRGLVRYSDDNDK